MEHGQQRKGPDADSVTAGVVLKEGMLSEQSRQRAVTEDVTPFTRRSQKDGVVLEVGVLSPKFLMESLKEGLEIIMSIFIILF